MAAGSPKQRGFKMFQQYEEIFFCIWLYFLTFHCCCKQEISLKPNAYIPYKKLSQSQSFHSACFLGDIDNSSSNTPN